MQLSKEIRHSTYRTNNMKVYNVNIISSIFVYALMYIVSWQDDDRKQIIVSTFGFLTGGTLAVNLTHFTFKPRGPLANKAPNETVNL